MAPKRRTSTPVTAPRSQQATLSFGKQNRITKSAAAQRNAKDINKDAKLRQVVQVDLTEPTTAEAAIEEQAAASLAKTTEDGLVRRKDNGCQSDDETRARRITDTQVKKYWRNKEAERKTPRLHQEGLTVGEKILREFDMSGQYGPCIGIARVKRWKRANTLALNPPIEVLAVLLKEIDNDNARAQRAHVDELMSSRFVET